VIEAICTQLHLYFPRVKLKEGFMREDFEHHGRFDRHLATPPTIRIWRPMPWFFGQGRHHQLDAGGASEGKSLQG